MGGSIRYCLVACAGLVGCGSNLQVGLANAPVLGGATPESRVHDVIANGRDACERSSFPQGQVLRGQLPPCSPNEVRAPVTLWKPPPSGPSLPPYSLKLCPARGQELTRADLGLTAISLSSSGGLVCREPW
jgi:hypothetical protein